MLREAPDLSDYPRMNDQSEGEFESHFLQKLNLELLRFNLVKDLKVMQDIPRVNTSGFTSLKFMPSAEFDRGALVW
jgi:hypothetical protein